MITIEELPFFSVACNTRAEAQADFPLVLREYIEALLASGATPPLPAAQTA